MIRVPRLITVLTTSLIGATIVMTQTAAAGPDAASDSQIDRRVRTVRADPDKDSSPFFWELLPGPQVRAMTGLQAKTPVDLSGVTIAEKTITEHGRNIKLYIVKPEKVDGTLPVFMFFHGGVRVAGNFESHKRFVRDLVVGSGAAAVFVESNPIPEENYAATAWVASHGAEIGVDATRLAVVGNSVGGDMAAAVAHELARVYPSVGAIALAASHEGGLGGCDDQVEFEFGLDLVLDGLERERARQASSRL